MGGKRKKEARRGAGSGDQPGGGGAGAGSEEAFTLPKAPERIVNPFKDALGPLKKQLEQQAKQQAQKKLEPPKPAPVPPRTRKQRGMAEDEASALSLAMHGVKPLTDQRAQRVSTSTPQLTTRTAKVAPFGMSAEEEARKRLDQLVAEDVGFHVEREGNFVRGLRENAQPRVLRELAKKSRPHDTLDLHGMTQREARQAVTAFVRASARKGLSVICFVHGKGNHSEGGLGVLREAVLSALTETSAAPLVLAFVTAPEGLGGTGSLLVELKG